MRYILLVLIITGDHILTITDTHMITDPPDITEIMTTDTIRTATDITDIKRNYERLERPVL